MFDEVRHERVDHALAALRALLIAHHLQGVVLTSPGSVAWASGGMNPSIDRTAAIDVVWVCVGVNEAVIVTTEIEKPRIVSDMEPAMYGFDTIAVSWWDQDAAVAAARGVFGSRAKVGADGHPGFELDLTDAIIAARMDLCAAEQDVLRALGRDAADSVQSALIQWEAGETDWEIQSRIVQAVEAQGADCPVVLVGVDERVSRFRHPVAIGAPAQHLVMAVLVARRSGLHVALTRYAHIGEVDSIVAEGIEKSRRVQQKVLAAAVPGATFGAVLEALDAAYTEEGEPEGWRQHYQGGPIGFAQREFEISPAQSGSTWWNRKILAGTAFAWNPSFPGGGKDEDTYITGGGRKECVTFSSEWPSVDSGVQIIPINPVSEARGG
jgi:Xaa-Pro dipeptidase